MLICNLSMRALRRGIAADLAEAGTADDALTPARILATLVDDPAAAHDVADAFAGVIMREAASASDAVTIAGSIFTASVNEAASADASVSVIGSFGALLSETATAADAPSAVVTSVTPGFGGTIALDGPINSSATPPTVILIEG